MNTTQTIIDLVAAKAGHPVYNPVGNVALGRILSISHSHVKRLRDGDGTLGRDAFVRACKFLDLPPERVIELTLSLDVDGSEDAGVRAWIHSLAKSWRGNVVKSGASILLGGLAAFGHVGDARATGNTALSRTAPAQGGVPDTVYYVKLRMRTQASVWLGCSADGTLCPDHLRPRSPLRLRIH